jgi:Transposase DDE domain
MKRNDRGISESAFERRIRRVLPLRLLKGICKRLGPVEHGPRWVRSTELIDGMVFHVLQGAGTLAQHVKRLTNKAITDGALSQRRMALPWAIFEEIMGVALRPKANPKQHPEAFYKGLRLCGADGSRASVANTPQAKESLLKAASRRHKAAFAQVSVVTVVELGLHNPIAAAIGPKNESEAVLIQQVWEKLPEKSLLLADRHHGVAKRLLELRQAQPEGRREFLARVKENLKASVLEVYPDGSALVQIRSGQQKMLVREIRGQVRRASGKWTRVRLWTSLLDWRLYPAHELLELYARRWEHEGFYRELKVDLRSSPLLQSHTPETAAQEIAALLLAYAMLVEERVQAAQLGQVEVLRISFAKVLEMVQGLWRFLQCAEGVLTEKQVRLIVRRAMRELAQELVPKRRQRACPRKLRKPVSGWPRLLRNTYANGPVEYELRSITA